MTQIIIVSHNLASLYAGILGSSVLDIVINIVLIVFIVYVAYKFLFSPFISALSWALNFRGLNDDSVFLEITPPKRSTKSPEATQQLIATISSVMGSQGIMSLEIVASFPDGIRILLLAHAEDVESLQKHLAAHVQGVNFRVLDKTYKPEGAASAQYSRLLELGQTNHYAIPFKPQEDYMHQDPGAFIAGSMAKLRPNEVIVLQVVTRQHHSWFTNRLHNQIASDGYAPLGNGLRYFILSRWWVWVVGGLFGLITNDLRAGLSLMVVLLVVEIFIPKKEVKLKSHDEQFFDEVMAKLEQPLFNADIRVLVTADESERLNSLVKGVRSAFASLNRPGHQGLRVKQTYPFLLSAQQNFKEFKFSKRLPSLIAFSSSVLSSSELGDVYHLPYGDAVNTEDMVKSLSKTLPAPLAMKKHTKAGDYDVVLGINHHHGSDTAIGLTAKEREKHVYVIGGTGNGKTTMLEYALLQDIKNGKGVAFIDPHGDAAQKLLKYIPKERMNDVVYLNPADIKFPIALNLLELPEGLDEDDLALEKERVTEAAISVFRKVFADDDANAHRIEAMFRNVIHTAFTVEGATLFTVLKLLRNTKYRDSVVGKLENAFLKDFWYEEFGKAGGMQRVSMSKGLTHRLDRFQSSEPVYRMMSQAKSTISFEDIMDSGKILICNFSQDIGEDTSTLFGTAVLAKLKIAAERRAKQPESSRKPFYVYVDEFQNFATTPFVKMLSASRKYKLFLTIAEQSTNQQEEQRLTEAILANVSTIVCFGLGSPADEQLLLPRFTPYLEKGDLDDQPSYNFYVKVKAERPMEPVSGETIVLPQEQASEKQAEDIILASRENYAVEYAKIKSASDSSNVGNIKNEIEPKTKVSNGLSRKSVKRKR